MRRPSRQVCLARGKHARTSCWHWSAPSSARTPEVQRKASEKVGMPCPSIWSRVTTNTACGASRRPMSILVPVGVRLAVLHTTGLVAASCSASRSAFTVARASPKVASCPAAAPGITTGMNLSLQAEAIARKGTRRAKQPAPRTKLPLKTGDAPKTGVAGESRSSSGP